MNFIPNQCTGCRVCEAVCSLSHEGAVNPSLSRIQIKTWPFNGYRSEVYACQHCKVPECMDACPTGALLRDIKTQAIVILEEECIGCQACIQACSQEPSRIVYNPEKEICIKCDLCGGDPLCVKHCMQGVIIFGKE